MMSRQIRKSILWKYFDSKSTNEAKCKFRGAMVKLGEGTSNLKGQFRRNHDGWDSNKENSRNSETPTPQFEVPEVSDSDSTISTAFSAASEPSVVESFDRQMQFISGGCKERQLTQSIIYMICKDNLPLSCTEKSGMRRFLKVDVPQYKPPIRATVTRVIEAKYEEF